jgi:hypothetical protein
MPKSDDQADPSVVDKAGENEIPGQHAGKELGQLV